MHSSEAKLPTGPKHLKFDLCNPHGRLKVGPSALPHKPWSSDSSEGLGPSLGHNHDIVWMSSA